MSCIWISIWLALINRSLSLPMMTNNEFHYYQRIRSSQSTNQINNNTINLNVFSINREHTSSHICSIKSIDIDTLLIGTNPDSNLQHSTSAKITTSDIIHFISSSQGNVLKDRIQIIFTIPFIISNESILNKTVFIIDVIHNQLLASLTDICINESSFIINYSTVKPLPHNICLYLLLNLASSTNSREIIFCRTIDYLYNNTSSSSDNQTDHTVGPSGVFILSQCIIILLMMFIIYGVQKAREKSLVNRVGQRLVRSRPYMTVFGNKTAVCTSSNAVNASLNAATTLQAGLYQFAFHRHLASISSHQMTTPIEEQVLAAHDLTSTINDRRATRAFINHNLIDLKEFTKRMSRPNASSADNELHVLNSI